MLCNYPIRSCGFRHPFVPHLRSFLPFGPGKNATPVSAPVSPNTSKSPFSALGSVRKSMTKERERGMSLTDVATPVIAIERLKDEAVLDDTVIRRSVSPPRLDKPLPKGPSFEVPSNSFLTESNLPSVYLVKAFAWPTAFRRVINHHRS